MVVATRCASVLHGFGRQLRIDGDMSICSSAQLARSSGVCFLSALIVQRRFLSIGSHVVEISVHMGKTGLGVFLHGSMAGLHTEHLIRDPLSHASRYQGACKVQA